MESELSASSSFAAVLHKLSELHKQEVNDLKQQLSQQLQVNEEQRTQIQQLRQCNQRLQQVISTAKKKIKQYKIPGHTDAEETTTMNDLESPMIQIPIQSSTSCVKDSPYCQRELNKTCVALFESPVVASSAAEEVEHLRLARNGTSTAGHHTTTTQLPLTSTTQLPLTRGESVETTAESCDVVIIDGDDQTVAVRGHHSHQSDGESDSEEEEEESSCEFTARSQSVIIQSEEMTSESEKHSNQHSDHSDNNENQRDAPIHLIYTHAHECGSSHGNTLFSEPEKSQSLTSPNKPVSVGCSLIRREVRGKVRYKVIEKPSTVSGSSSSNLIKVDDRDDGSISSLSQDDSLQSDSDSSSSSPSLLNTSSQLRAPVDHGTHTPTSHIVQHDVMTCSLFPSTPLTSTINGDCTIEVTTTPANTGQLIPKTDSQLSLDFSQSIPYSPELKDPFIMKQSISSKPQTADQDDLCIEINSEPVSPEEVVKDKHPTNKQLSLRKRKLSLSNQRVVICEEKSQCDVSSSPGNKLASPRNVVLATPGVKSVNNILQRTNGWMAIQSNIHPTTTTVITHSPKHRHSHQEDIEEVIPSKKLHLDSDCRKIASETRQSLLSQLTQDNDETRMMGGAEHTQALLEINPSVNLNTSHEPLVENTNDHHHNSILKLAKRAGLPVDYKFSTVIRKKADRDKLEGKACPDCEAWYMEGDGIHDGQREHLKHTCRHKHLHLPPDTDPRLWEISFPDSVECEKLMK